MDLEEEEPDRPQFKSSGLRPNIVTGKLEKVVVCFISTSSNDMI
jgi:hypothetical protein